VTTSSDLADKQPRVIVTSSNDECETHIRTTSLPLPWFDYTAAAVNNGDHPENSEAVAYNLADAKNSRRMRSQTVNGVSGHVSQNGGDQYTCEFDSRVHSQGGSTYNRCSGNANENDDDGDDEAVMSHYDQSAPIVSPQITYERFVFTIRHDMIR